MYSFNSPFYISNGKLLVALFYAWFREESLLVDTYFLERFVA